jgi:hypothetical protein
MLVEPIFKVNKLTNKNIIEKIYVFNGKDKVSKKEIFNNEELVYIEENNVEVIFVNEQIHIDDNIGTIKLKIFEYCLGKSISMSELYLFCLKDEYLNPINIYQSLTQNDRLPLTRVRINQILLNIYEKNEILEHIDFSSILSGKSFDYNFDDILKLDLTDREYLVGKTLGQKLIFTGEYPFIVDPFYVNEYDSLLENSRREITTLSNNLLLETGEIYNNNIYLCVAEDVFKYMENQGLSSEYTSKIYFPFLYIEDINNLDKLIINRNKLIEKTLNILTPDTEKIFENVNMFYNIYKNKLVSEKFYEKENNSGITFFRIVLHPDFKIRIPVDVIFKLIHATEDYPLIKFNPETRQENMYRLYVDKMSTDGRKVPYLNKATILKLMRNIGKTKSVSIYTNIVYENDTYQMSCEFNEDGSIMIYPLIEFEKPIINFDKINNLIKLTINPLIEQIKSFFAQSGLEIKMFETIESPNIEVRSLTYQTKYYINKELLINKYKGCLSSIFVVESDNIKKGIQLRFKRVSNFSKQDSQQAFIIEKIDEGLKFNDIIEELKNNYENINDEIAIEMIAKTRDELEIIRGANKKRSLMIKINPGFKTNIKLEPITSEIVIRVEGINNIYYLKTIPIYIDSLIRITQDIKSTSIKSAYINKLCSGKELDDVEFGQITALSEQSVLENKIPDSFSYEDDMPIYAEEQGENMDELLEMLGYSDEDVSDIVGGDNSESSVSVISDSLNSEVSPKGIPSSKEVSSEGIPSSKEVSPEGIPSSKEVSPEGIPSSKEVSPEGIPSSKEVSSEGILISKELTKEESAKEEEESSKEEEESSKEEEESTKQEEESSKEEEESSKEEEESTKQEEESSKQEEESAKKQAITKKIENTFKNIVGMKLRYPNPFTSRLEERAPQLFVREKNEKIDLYSRMCPFSLSDRRQPIILTKEEKEEMINEHPDVVNEESDFIEYSTDPNDSSKKFYYTCPRYWCLLTDKMVTEKDILDGKCGPKVSKIEDAIIPKTAKEVPKNKYVYQFYDKGQSKYPGFHKEKTPSGLCIPCCYNKWSTKEMKNRRDICQGKEITLPITQKEKELKKQLEEAEQYIKGPEKYPLGDNRWGFLPISVQKFLHEVNDDCLVSKTNVTIKYNHTCLLRHGVEVNANQSFIACIASALFYAQYDESNDRPLINKYLPNVPIDKFVPNIKEMKTILINALNIDNFIKLQNGDLIQTFYPNSSKEVNLNDEKYVSSELFKKIKNNEPNQLLFFEKVVKSYENFIEYLKNDNIFIDYTYLWDLVCTPNPKLFEAGINLIILEIPDDDITNNIELVCPTNHYSTHIYNARRRSLILIKRDNYFEPVYGYKHNQKRLLVIKMFSEYDRTLPQTLRSVFSKIIKPTLGEKCKSFISRPNEYRFKQPPLLDNLIKELVFKKYKVIKQILNYQGKVIGVIASNRKGLEGFIPCYPSSLTILKEKVECDEKDKCERDYNYDYVSDNVWYTYEETLRFLKSYYNYEEQNNLDKAKCSDDNYFCLAIEDELVIGFLTNTNQFIRIKDPIPVSQINDNIKSFTTNNMLVADMNTLVNKNVDDERVKFMKKIQLETQFYNVFRNTIRILFNDYSNSEKRKKIKDECNKRFLLYKAQLDKVVDLLYDLVDDNIVFISDRRGTFDGLDYTELDPYNITTCIVDKNKCETSNNLCRLSSNKDKCVLFLPKNNLVTNNDNEIYYYTRMADELIRYNRIKSFIFKPQSYLSFNEIQYNLRDNEIIVLQSLLTQEFFDGLDISRFAMINKYAKYNNYDNAQPIITQNYDNKIILDEIINPNNIRDCFPSEEKNISSKYWRNCFPLNYSELVYSNSKFCALYLIVDLIKSFKNIDVSVEQLKDDLIEEYESITDNFKNTNRINKIIDILREEGQYDANQLMDETINFREMILQDGFIPVNLDIRLLLIKYKIPSFFISKKFLPETRFNKKEFVCYTNESENINEYAFIITPAMYRRKRDKLPIFRVILNEENNTKIDIRNITSCNTNIREAIESYIPIEEYIDFIFEKDLTTIYKQRQKGLRELEFEIDEEEKEEEVPKPKKKKYKKEVQLIIEEDEDEDKQEQEKQEKEKQEEDSVEEFFEPLPKKKKIKTKKIKTTNLGKRKTRRKLQENIEIIDEV